MKLSLSDASVRDLVFFFGFPRSEHTKKNRVAAILLSDRITSCCVDKGNVEFTLRRRTRYARGSPLFSSSSSSSASSSFSSSFYLCLRFFSSFV